VKDILDQILFISNLEDSHIYSTRLDSNDLPATQDAWFVMTSAVPRVAMKNIYRASLVAVAQAVSEVSYPSAASAAPPWGGLGVWMEL